MAKKVTIYLATASIILAGLAVEAAAQSGIASIYSYKTGRTASGERAHPTGLTAAHRSLPFGTKVRVTNRRNGHSAGAGALGFSGLAPVHVAVLN